MRIEKEVFASLIFVVVFVFSLNQVVGCQRYHDCISNTERNLEVQKECK